MSPPPGTDARLLSCRAQVVRILSTAEEGNVGKPHAFNGWTKLELIYRKALTVPEGMRRASMEFIVETLWHMQVTGAVSGGGFSKRVLQGEGRKAISLLDLILLRFAIAQKMVSIVPACQTSLQVLVSPCSCAKLMGTSTPPGPDADLGGAGSDAELAYEDGNFYAWSSKLPQSGILAAEALRDLHAGDLDGSLRYILKEKRGASMEEVFQTGAVKDILGNIQTQVAGEAEPEPAEVPISPSPAAVAVVAVGEQAPQLLDPCLALQEKAPTLESDMAELVSQWLKHVRAIWRRRVQLLLVPAGSPQVQLDALKRTPAGQYGAGGSAPRDAGGSAPRDTGGSAPREGFRRAFVLDAKVGRQSSSSLRFGEVLPLERSDLERAHKIITNMTDTPGSAADTDCIFIFDGKHAETRSLAAKVFPAPEWKGTDYSLVYRYDDLEKRMHHTRSDTMIRLTEHLLVFGTKPLRLALKTRLFFGGSNRCDAFVNVPLEFDGVAGARMVTMGEKKDIMQGRTGVAIGKAKGCSPGPPSAKKQRHSDDQEDDRVVAAFPDAPHSNVATEMWHCFNLDAVVDFFAGSGCWARMAVTRDVAYTGFCFNESHRAFVSKALDDFVFDQIAVPGTPMYRETFAKAVQNIRDKHSPKGASAGDGGGSSGGSAPKSGESGDNEGGESEAPSPDPEESSPESDPEPTGKAKGKAKAKTRAKGKKF